MDVRSVANISDVCALFSRVEGGSMYLQNFDNAVHIHIV
jgi:hypothetical protein